MPKITADFDAMTDDILFALDKKAVSVAVLAYDVARCAAHGGDQPMSDRNRETITPMIAAAIAAYLRAAQPQEAAR